MKNMSFRRVVVTGLGLVSPIGNTVEEFRKSLIEGRNGVSPITQFDSTGYDSRIAGEVGDFDPPEEIISAKDKKRLSRFIQFASWASFYAVKDSGIQFDKEDPLKSGVLIGSGIGCLWWIEEQHKVLLSKGPSRISPFLIPMLIVNQASGYVAIQYGLRGPNICITTACASGSHSIGEAFRMIKYGYADVMVTGGTEACITTLAVSGFSSMKALSTRNDAPEKASRPFDRERDGFVIAEGCGVVVLEEYEHAKKRGAHIYGELAGYSATCDACHITAPDPEGKGAATAMKDAVKEAGLSPKDISYINAHGTSTQLNDKVETLAIKTTFGDQAYKIPVSSTKSMTGHLLGAAGGVEFIACCLALDKNFIPPTINYEFPDPECDLDYVPNEPRNAKLKAALSNSLGFGGHNATLVLKKI